MAYPSTITDVLNIWADFGVFAYVLPFLMIFALVYGILSNTNILGKNKGVHITLALVVGLLSLQFDYVSNFFATIFPYAGIGISVLLVALILMGMLASEKEVHKWIFFGIGVVIFLVVLFYTISDFQWLGGYIGGGWVPWIAIILILAGVITALVLSGNRSNSPTASH